MLLREAEWLSGYFERRWSQPSCTVLNLGSSTAEFRERVQPFIHRLIFEPIERRGGRVVHTDLKDEDGETIPADISRDEDLDKLRAIGARTVLCSNMLEHVPCVNAMAARLAELVPQGGTLIVTVPNSYPYHPDPIDNLFRPGVEELRGLFPQFELLEGAIVEGPSLFDEFREKPSQFVRRLARSLLPYGFSGWVTTVDRWRWLFRPYKVTCVILRRRSE